MFRDLVTTEDALRALVGTPSDLALKKQISALDAHCQDFIAHAPFLLLATANAAGQCDVSPKGDAPGFVRVLDDKTLAIPDRPGNNRIDGFTNILRDPRIALLFLIPGCGETLRVNGKASITVDPELMQGFAVNGKPPRCVLVVHIERVYFHCAKAIMRSRLWDEASKVDRKTLPSAGALLGELTQGELGGETYDREAPERMKAGLY